MRVGGGSFDARLLDSDEEDASLGFFAVSTPAVMVLDVDGILEMGCVSMNA